MRPAHSGAKGHSEVDSHQMGVLRKIRCMVGSHSWRQWEFTEVESVQERACLYCQAAQQRNVLKAFIGSGEGAEASLSQEMLHLQPSRSRTTDAYGGGHSEDVELFVIQGGGDVMPLHGSLATLPEWEKCRYFLVRTNWETRTFWQQQRDGYLEGYDVSSGSSVKYSRIRPAREICGGDITSK